MIRHMLYIIDIEKICRQAHIHKIKLWGFNKPFSEIFIVRAHQVDYIACFQNRKPTLSRIVIDSNLERSFTLIRDRMSLSMYVVV